MTQDDLVAIACIATVVCLAIAIAIDAYYTWKRIKRESGNRKSP